MFELDLGLVSQGLTWILSTGAGALGSYKLLQYRIGKIEELHKNLAEEVRRDVVHTDHCLLCKENMILRVREIKS
jgi:alpha-D-ribose 1-methylphosphonate 5-triphosphate diphosphatase PhnM